MTPPTPNAVYEKWLCCCDMVTGGALITNPLCLMHSDVQKVREVFRADLSWERIVEILQTPAPVFNGLSAAEWVRRGHSWSQYIALQHGWLDDGVMA